MLAALLAVIVVVAVFAVASQRQAQSAERKANDRPSRRSPPSSWRHVRCSGARIGGDRRAIQQMVAAERLAPGSDPGALLETLDDERRLVKVIATPSNVNSLAVSPDGRQMIRFGRSGSYDPPLGTRDPETRSGSR